MKAEKINLLYYKNITFDIFKKISNKNYSMLLSSGNNTHQYGRFDIIVSDPKTIILTNEKITKIYKNKKIKTSKLNPFDIVKKEINFFKIKPKFNEELPFQGGALGIFSYDLIINLKKIKKKLKKKLRFPNMAIGIYLWSIIIDHFKKKATLISYEDIKKRKKWLETQNYKPIKTKIIKPWKSNMSKNEYFKKFKKIKKYLKNGECYQINLSKRFHIKYNGDEWNIFCKLNEINQAPFSSFIRLKKNTILSFSPERFILLKKNIIQSRPIKGTIPRSKNKEKDKKQIKILKKSKKNKAENIMIVDLIRNDIGKTAIPGTISVPELFSIESFSNVHHLVSTITAKLKKKYEATDLLKKCFPGGSITGAPKLRAIEIIEEIEPHRRYGYCGSIGYISFCGNMDTNINIRSILTENKKIYCWGGGGIVSDSLPKEEYEEILNKLNKILPVL